MFNKQVAFIHIFSHSCSQYKIIKYPEYYEVNELVKGQIQKTNKGSVLLWKL